MKGLHMITFLLTIIGGLNWGLVGIGGLMGSDWNVVHMIVGSMPTLEAVVYILVGLSAVWLMLGHKKDCRMCSGGM
jgi:uncharacterized membrane protein YuzA (DUF378 family)